jgi:hypothetical protein
MVTEPSVAKIALKVRISGSIVAVQRRNTGLQKMLACAYKHKRGEPATALGLVVSLNVSLLPMK